MRKVTAVILAGGKGKRMGILCRHRPKPALPYGGMYRVIDLPLSNCLHSKIGSVAILTDYQRSFMASYLRRWHTGTISDRGFQIDILEASSHYLGTADAVYQNLGYLRNHGVETVLVLAADHVYKMDYRQMLSFHNQTKADVTVGVVSMSPEQAQRFGTMTVDTNNRILDFAEKPEIATSNIVSMGIYVFNLETLIEPLCEDGAESDSAHDFGYSIIPRMVRQDRVFAYQFDGYWRDIGTMEAYYVANMELAYCQPCFSLDGAWPIVTARNQLPEPNVPLKGRINNSIVSPGCTIKGCVENSVISPGVWVEEHAVVRNSVLINNVFIGEHSEIESCILDEGVSIGQSCRIGAKDGFGIASDSVTILGKDIVVPSYTSVGQNKADALQNDITNFIAASHISELCGALSK